MKKLAFFAVLALCFGMVPAQEQPEAPPEPQVQDEAQPPPQAQLQGRDLKRVRFPQAFIHSGKEYPAGDYWLVLIEKDGQPIFTVQNAQKEMLFEEWAVVKSRGGSRSGRGFSVRKQLMKGGEYFRVLVTTPAQWLMGYFLIKS